MSAQREGKHGSHYQAAAVAAPGAANAAANRAAQLSSFSVKSSPANLSLPNRALPSFAESLGFFVAAPAAAVPDPTSSVTQNTLNQIKNLKVTLKTQMQLQNIKH